MHPVPMHGTHPQESDHCELSSLEGRKQAACALSYASAQSAQTQRLLHFRRTHTPRQLLVEDACWEYLLGGQGKEVILLLPGGACIAEWNFERILALERRYTVLSPSDPAQVSTMAQIVRGLASILEYEGIARVHLIGISLGGMEAQCFVRAYPHLVHSLILCQIGVPTRLFASLLGTGARLLSLLPPRLLRAAAKQAILHSFATSDPERGFWNAYLDDLFTFPVGRAKERMVSACRKISDFGKRYMFAPADLVKWPGRILILNSERDHWIPARLLHRLCLLYPQAQVYRMVHAGHILGTQERVEYLAVVERFLTEASQSTRYPRTPRQPFTQLVP